MSDDNMGWNIVPSADTSPQAFSIFKSHRGILSYDQAKFVAAAANACKGIRTEVLEAATTFEVVTGTHSEHIDAMRARCAEHEQFRNQHRDCDKMSVELQALREALVAVLRAAKVSDYGGPDIPYTHGISTGRPLMDALQSAANLISAHG